MSVSCCARVLVNGGVGRSCSRRPWLLPVMSAAALKGPGPDAGLSKSVSRLSIAAVGAAIGWQHAPHITQPLRLACGCWSRLASCMWVLVTRGELHVGAGHAWTWADSTPSTCSTSIQSRTLHKQVGKGAHHGMNRAGLPGAQRSCRRWRPHNSSRGRCDNPRSRQLGAPRDAGVHRAVGRLGPGVAMVPVVQQHLQW